MSSLGSFITPSNKQGQRFNSTVLFFTEDLLVNFIDASMLKEVVFTV